MPGVYMITNRKLEDPDDTLDLFRKSKFGTDPTQVRTVRINYKPDKDNPKKWDLSYEYYEDSENGGSHRAFTELQKKMKDSSTAIENGVYEWGMKKDCLIFVHGYNNDWEDTVWAAITLSEVFDINVVCFSWPSGNALRYINCKDRAISSGPAFNRFMEKFTRYMGGTTERCGQKVSFVAHSMGNYLLKNFIKSTWFDNEFIPFHNVNIAAADVNHEGHEKFIDKIHCLNDVNVFINKDDFALDFSDTKMGKKQKVRLGNTVTELNSKKAYYYNVTGAKGVQSSHDYFKDKDILKENEALFNLFYSAYHGDSVEGMEYKKGLNYYVPPKEFTERRKWWTKAKLPNM